MQTKIITLASDFGLKDPYVAEMKAVILSISPNVTLIDVTHEVNKFDIRMGAYVLASVVPYFPTGTIHVGVIDPGVGTSRRPLLIETSREFFVGPDNGLLILAAEKQNIKSIREITNPQFMLKEISSTFHGRDVFAPAAAYLAEGISPSEFGPEVIDAIRPEFAKAIKTKDMLIGEVLHIDDFGNIITNIEDHEITNLNSQGILKIELPNYKLKLRFCKAYADAAPQEPIALIGSHSYLEIAMNQSNAAKKYATRPGDKVRLLLT